MESQSEQQKPRPYHHGDLRNGLIQAGLELLEEGSALELDLRKVARRAGVSHGAPYRHFADKQALLAAIIEEGFRLLAREIREGQQGQPDEPFEQLLGVARAYVHFAQAHPWLMREMFIGLAIGRENHEGAHRASKEVYRIYTAVIGRGQEQGKLVAGDLGVLAGVFWSALHGLAILIIEKQLSSYADGPEGTERVTRYTIEVLYHGLAAKQG